jgi:ATP-dependent DNA helicase RecG
VGDLDLEILRMEFGASLGLAVSPEESPQLEPWLRQRGIVRRRDGGWEPTGAGVLVYGIDPQSYVPWAIVEFTRYAGDSIEAPIISRKIISGRLPDQLRGSWTQLQANLVSVAAPADGVRSPYVPEYPLEALKELARNLVQHRMYEGTNAPSRVTWFDDRIEMTNPGGPFGQANEGEFGEHSDYRNPTITRLLVDLGYVERLGGGVQRARALLAANGNPGLDVETELALFNNKGGVGKTTLNFNIAHDGQKRPSGRSARLRSAVLPLGDRLDRRGALRDLVETGGGQIQSVTRARGEFEELVKKLGAMLTLQRTRDPA